LNKKLLFLGALILLLIGIPTVVFLSQKNQETRSLANASTTLYLTPSSTSSTPLKTRVGDKVSFDVMVDPGKNLVTFIKLELVFDPHYLQPDLENSFIPNQQAFPQTLEGPITNKDSYIITLTVGPDPSKAINKVTKVGTLTLTASSMSRKKPVIVSFGTKSEVLSINAADQANENVLSTTIPAYLTISPGTLNSLTPTPQPLSPLAHTVLSLSPNPLNIIAGGTGKVDVNIDTSDNSATAVQLELSYDPNMLENVNIQPAQFFSSPVTLINKNNPTTGRFTYAFGASPGGQDSPAKGLVATISFTAKNVQASKSDLTLLPETIVTARGEAHSVLKSSSGTQINLVTDGNASSEATTKLSINALLHGIGTGGDNANPKASNSDGKNPLHPIRNLEVSIYNIQNQLVASPKGTITYNPTNGNFAGVIDVKENLISGTYLVRIKSPGYLTRFVPGNQIITSGQENILPSVSLVTGDINGDNVLNTLDYSLLQGCYGTTNKNRCSNDTRQLADLNDDGSVNVIDLNIFLREFSIAHGD